LRWYKADDVPSQQQLIFQTVGIWTCYALFVTGHHPENSLLEHFFGENIGGFVVATNIILRKRLNAKAKKHSRYLSGWLVKFMRGEKILSQKDR